MEPPSRSIAASERPLRISTPCPEWDFEAFEEAAGRKSGRYAMGGVQGRSGVGLEGLNAHLLDATLNYALDRKVRRGLMRCTGMMRIVRVGSLKSYDGK